MPNMKATARRVHLIGVGGIGMRGLARMLVAGGVQVTGSDRDFDRRRNLALAETLQRAGVRIFPQDGSGVTAETDRVVYSTAIESGNPDLLSAQRLNIPQLHRSEALWELIRDRRTVAVAGSCGKTTVAAMIGHGLREAGRDPLVVVGGVVAGWEGEGEPGTALAGKGDVAVFEADESDHSLLRYQPDLAVLGPITADHFPRDEAAELFKNFIQNVRETVIVCSQAAGELKDTLERSRLRVVLTEAAIYRTALGWEARWQGKTIRSPLPGRFNLENTLLALAALQELGISREKSVAALERFRGVRRRLELVGTAPGGIRIYDDYAHNPAKIAAAWEAVRESGGRRVVGIWQPHGYGPLAAMLKDLAKTFAAVMHRDEVLFLLPVYYAGGTADKRFESKDLAKLVCDLGRRVECVAREESAHRVAEAVMPGDSVLLMGARDPELSQMAADLLHFLSQRGRTSRRD